VLYERTHQRPVSLSHDAQPSIWSLGVPCCIAHQEFNEPPGRALLNGTDEPLVWLTRPALSRSSPADQGHKTRLRRYGKAQNIASQGLLNLVCKTPPCLPPSQPLIACYRSNRKKVRPVQIAGSDAETGRMHDFVVHICNVQT
jgi:hypothetical protein